MLHKIRILMENNKYLMKLVNPILNTKIMAYRRDAYGLRDAKQIVSEFKANYEAHKAEFEKVFQMLEDDFSRKTLQAVIDYRLNPQGGGTERRNRNAAVFYA